MKLLKTAVASVAVLSAAALVSANDISEATREVDSFTKVKLEGSMDVEVKVGPAQSVRVIADSDVIEYLRTEVHGGELEIELKHHKRNSGIFRRVEKMLVVVTVPSLESAEVQGSGDMIVEDVAGSRFELDVHGSGDAIVKNAKVETLNLDLQGSGDIEISGSCDDVRIELQGSGDIKADRMECKSADVMLMGSGDIGVFANVSADVTVRGSGDISVFGKPDKISSRVRGSGDIHVRK